MMVFPNPSLSSLPSLHIPVDDTIRARACGFHHSSGLLAILRTAFEAQVSLAVLNPPDSTLGWLMEMPGGASSHVG